jgi:cyclopropane-fatty-acyl-phospholipid synthase
MARLTLDPIRTAPAAGDDAVRRTRALLADLFGPPPARGFAVRLWDGTVEAAGGGPSRFTLVLRRPGALRRLLLPPSELALAEAYLRDDIDIEGDLEAATGLADLLPRRLAAPLRLARLAAGALGLPDDDREDAGAAARTAYQPRGRRHSRRRDAGSVRYHYDVGNDFYALWLDRRLVYSCAYFPTGAEDLDAAQAAKLEYICRKLRLQPGERLLDIGCGWGGLVQYAAEHYGVAAVGITLSQPQAELARARLAAAGLADRCQVMVRDYRDLPRTAVFDKVVSVGMVEHVGQARLPEYYGAVYRALRPGGLFLNHGIVVADGRPPGPADLAARRLWQAGAFVRRYVFPDGELVTPAALLAPAEAAGFETRDLESLREHYALTLRHWVRRLEARHAEAAALVGEPTYRVWRLYMAGSAHGFATGRLGIVQALFSKADRDGSARLPLTRADLYRAEAPVGR